MNDNTLVFSNLLRDKARLLLLSIPILIGFFLFGALDSIRIGLASNSSSGAGQRLITANTVSFTQPLPVSYTDRIKQVAGVEHAVASTWYGGYFNEPSNFVLSYATNFDDLFEVFPEYVLSEGQLKDCVEDQTGLLVGRAMARQYGWALGDDVALSSNAYVDSNGQNSWSFRVCGVFEDTAQSGADFQAFLQYDYLNNSRAIGQNQISIVTLKISEDAQGVAIGRTVDRMFENSSYRTTTVSEQQFAAAFADQLGDIGLLITAVVGAAFVSILLIVGSTMIVTARQRMPEISVLKILGFPSNRIARIIIGETLAISAIAGFIGIFLAQIFTFGISNIPGFAAFRMGWETWANGLLLVVFLGVIVAIGPLYSGLKSDILSGLGRR